MDKRKALIIGGAGLLILLLGLLAFFLLKSPGDGAAPAEDPAAAKRANIMTLARDYMEQHEFQRALDLLDGLLIEDANDQEVRDLQGQDHPGEESLGG